MTVSNVIFERDRLRLASDTLCYRAKKPAFFERKIRIAERSGVALIVRGLVRHADVIESVADELDDLEQIAFATEHYFSSCDVAHFSRAAPTAEATILGWDNGRPRGLRIAAALEGGAMKVRRFELEPGVYLAPNLGTHQIPTALSEDQIVKISLLQQSLSLKHNLNMCVGGDIELAEITADGASIRKIGEYPDKAMTERRIAKLNRSDADILSVAA